MRYHRVVLALFPPRVYVEVHMQFSSAAFNELRRQDFVFPICPRRTCFISKLRLIRRYRHISVLTMDREEQRMAD